MAFDKQETAVRVREIIKAQANKQIDINVPRPLVGRMTSIDLNNLRCMVWFPGDEVPIQVSLFSSTIPSTSEAGFPQGVSSSLQGFGSMVACQRLNGILYVTHVLAGGQFSYDFEAFNWNLISTYPYDESQGGVQELTGEVVEAHLGFNLTGIGNGQSCEFGPFIRNLDNGYTQMWVEMDLISDGIASKSYKFQVSPFWDLDTSIFDNGGNDKWFRILPCAEITDSNQQDMDWDLDMCIKDTPYGLTPLGLQKSEVWFRVIARGTEAGGINLKGVVRSPVLNRDRSVDGLNKFVNIVQTNSELVKYHKGFVGFHNSSMTLFDYDNSKIRDTFNRTVTDGVGALSDWPESWVITGSGAAANFDVANGPLEITLTSANVSHRVYIGGTSPLRYDHDVVTRMRCSQVALTQPIQGEIRLRKTADTTFYMFRVEWKTNSNINLVILKNVAGVVTTLVTATDVIAYTAGQILFVRAELKNDKAKMKIWNTSASEPVLWQADAPADTSITGAGTLELQAIRVTGNTNTNPIVAWHEIEDNVSPQVNGLASKWHTGPWRGSALRVAQDLQRTMMIDGYFVWDGSNISWTGLITLGGIGRSRDTLTHARHWITCPFNVSNYVIPRLGIASPTTINITSSGIPLAAGDTLYCGIPPGEIDQDLIYHLFIVGETTLGVEFHLPEWAVMIARRRSDLSHTNDDLGAMPIKLGTGEWLDKWHNVGTGGEPAFGTNWTNLGGSFRSVGFRKTDPEHVELKGMADFTSTTTAPNTIFTLPVGYRPSSHLNFLVGNNPGDTVAPTLRGLQIQSGGLVRSTHFTGTIDPSPVSLEGIKFSITG